MKRAALLLACLSFLGISCERHSWEDTKGLHKHGADKAHDPAGGGDSHATGHGEPATGEGHGAKQESAPH